MDPITVSTALQIAKAVGVDKLISKLFGSSKAGEVAEKVISAAQAVTGHRNIPDIEAAIAADPSLALQITMQVNQISADYDNAVLADIADARDMQIAALQQQDIFVRRFLYYFAIGIMIVATGFIFGVTFVEIPEDNLRVVDTIMGWMTGTMMSTVLYFFYGASHRPPTTPQHK